MKTLLKFSPAFAILIGIALLFSGVGGALYTYKSVTREQVVTTGDSAIPNTPVRGPFTLKAQADIIREHVLRKNDRKTFAEMPRTVQQRDADGNPILDKDNNPVMIPNAGRKDWIDATALTTALNLALLSYAFSGLVILIGLIMIWIGAIVRHLRCEKRH